MSVKIEGNGKEKASEPTSAYLNLLPVTAAEGALISGSGDGVLSEVLLSDDEDITLTAYMLDDADTVPGVRGVLYTAGGNEG